MTFILWKLPLYTTLRRRGRISSLLDETHGTSVSFRQQRWLYRLPLYALEAPYADAQTQQLINDYATWFSGHQ